MKIAVFVYALFMSSLTFAQTPQSQNDFFVRWKLGTPAAARVRYYQRAQVRSVWHSSLVWGLERLQPLDLHASGRNALEVFKSSPRVIYAEPNFHVQRHLAPVHGFKLNELPSLHIAPNDPLYPQQWALTQGAGLDIEDAWAITKGSANVRVAVIDTGVDATHEDLQGHVTSGYDFIDNTDQVTDHEGHGTHVSGIIGANTDNGKGIAGISPNITIIPIRAIPSQGDETDANEISAFEYAVKQGARIANCSFGKAESSQAVEDTISAAGDQGLLAVVAAGNDSDDLHQNPAFPASFHTANMIVVASTDPSGDLSDFSNFGLGLVDVAAPGNHILSSVPGNQYQSMDGTSMAAPQVVGVAALVLAVNPSLTVSQLKDILLKSVDLDDRLKEAVTTGGHIDAALAVRLATTHFSR